MTSNDEVLPLIQVQHDPYSSNPINPIPIPNPSSNPSKRKRSLPGTPDPDAEVIALSPKSLMATNRFMCDICNKGFKRDQNLQLHRRGHNLPWKLKQRNHDQIIRKKVYICPETTCAHHDSSRALGDLTGIKKHYSRKHGEKKWKCDKCSKKYAVISDWKAHTKICGTREYKCHCGTLFARKDSFITHRAFCDALVKETAGRFNAPSMHHNAIQNNINHEGNLIFSGSFGQQLLQSQNHLNLDCHKSRFPLWLANATNANAQLDGMGNENPSSSRANFNFTVTEELAAQNQWWSWGQEESFVGGEEEDKPNLSESISSSLNFSNHIHQQTTSPAPMSATALLQKAAQIGSLNSFSRSTTENLIKDQSSLTQMGVVNSKNNQNGIEGESSALTRDFLGVGGREESNDDFFTLRW